LEFTVDDIRSFLSHQSTYKRHLGFNLQYKQQKHTVVPGPLVKWQIDLADMQNSAEYNDGTNYLLTIIDVFSKYALVIPLQNKQGQTIARALDYIFRIKINNKAYKPMILLSDNGKEFIAKEVKQVCTDHGIHQLTSYPYTPLGIIERFNKTIKQKIAQYLSVYRTQRYIDALELITENYNHSYHHTIRELPANVHFANRSLHKLLIPQLHNYYKYLNDKNNPIISETLHYTRGDKVRIQAHITPFIAPEQQRRLSAKTKSTVPNWSSEVYTVTKKIIDGKFIFYQVKAASGVVNHRKYYHWQLQKQ
jgi:transposase InsO family protein